MEISILGVIVATIVQFAIGAIWYTFIFGKLWGKIHGFDNFTPEVQAEMMKQMPPLYGGQLLVTVFSSFVLAVLMKNLPDFSPYLLALLIWFGFYIPTQYSDTIFGGTEGKWIISKLGILAGSAILSIEAAALILSYI